MALEYVKEQDEMEDISKVLSLDDEMEDTAAQECRKDGEWNPLSSNTDRGWVRTSTWYITPARPPSRSTLYHNKEIGADLRQKCGR